jgi:hypothetical protein
MRNFLSLHSSPHNTTIHNNHLMQCQRSDMSTSQISFSISADEHKMHPICK